MKERGKDITQRSLSEGHLADRLMQDRLDIDKRAVKLEHLFVLLFRHHVDVAEKTERFDQGERPPKLASLSENNADVLGVLRSFFIRDDAVNENVAGGRLKDAGHHLDRCGFSRSVRS